MSGVAHATAVREPRHASGFWTVAYALLIVMAFATLPSPLYGLYRTEDDLSSLMITVIYGIFAGGTIATLLAVPSIAAHLGRRGVMLTAVGTMILADGLLAGSKALPTLLIARLLAGASAGLAAGTAITYLIELRLRADPRAALIRARNTGTAVNVGALGVGPLIAGALAEWARWPLTLPYLVWGVLGMVALVSLLFVPETGTPAPRERTANPRGGPGPVRLPIPAAAGTMAAFAASGLFAGLAGLILSTTLGHPSHALAGATLFLVFSSGAASQLATARLQASRILALGTFSMLAGLVLLSVSVRVSTAGLALFLLSGALIGAGVGSVFKGTTGIVLEASPPEQRLAMTSALLVALYVGLSIPVIGAGIALNAGASAADTVLGFAILVALAVAASGWALLQRRQPLQSEGGGHAGTVGA